MSGYLLARMAAASSAALTAPELPMARVPTGIPPGICTVDRSESMPLSARDWMGTPSTGSSVLAAATPARWAAPPAPAMMTSRPRPSAPATYSSTRSGVRCADMIRASCGMASASSVSAAWLMVSQSDLEPMMIPTSGAMARYCSRASGRERDPLDHAAHGGLQHQLPALVGHLVLVGDDAAVRLLGLALVGDRHRHADGVSGEDGGDDPDLAAEIGHAGAVDEPGLHDEPFRQAEGEGAGHRPALEHRLLRHVLHVHEEGLGEPAEVHEGGDVGVADGAAECLVPRADLVLLVGQSLLDHGWVSLARKFWVRLLALAWHDRETLATSGLPQAVIQGDERIALWGLIAPDQGSRELKRIAGPKRVRRQ